MKQFTVGLYDLEFDALIGCLPQEHLVSQTFIVSVEVRIPISEELASSDSISDTINYAELYETVRECFTTPTRLLETIALRMEEVIKLKWPQVSSGRISIRKTNPPIPGIVGTAGVTIDY